MKNAGIIGCGAMGRGMVKNLIKHQYNVFVYDIDPDMLAIAESLGATPKENISELAKEVDFLLTSLPKPEILKDALTGPNGAIQHMNAQTFILDMGTTDVGLTKELYQTAKDSDIFFFDCPVSNGPVGAESGTLTIMVGGEEEHYESIVPVLQSVGKEIRYIGPAGSGQVVKLCNNMVVAGIMVLLSETLLTGVKAGVDAKQIAEVMSIGSAQSKVLSVFGPNLLHDTHQNINFFLGHMAKDVGLYTDLARYSQAPSLLGSMVQQLFEIARIQGKGNLDTSAVVQVIETMGQQKIV
ncbi:NAD(P)-dependent oxidoreductase [Bacillus sp. V3-13]|uniref:NAD(P)-dependent oxidoreductase n=1 Tax=Bacillus sp. V3-13 TaxID=2053728 RepID=UPI000C791707|nr:NAD(P)-dependent oxidoreductase [Bacillus sp. V3-13]PLR78326.1 NAD(P)-dependent oxidoreductase [Bacillus sp. V3-13]